MTLLLQFLFPVCAPPVSPVNAARVSGEEGAKPLPSEALMKEGPGRSLHHGGDAITERAHGEEGAVQQVTTNTHIACQVALIRRRMLNMNEQQCVHLVVFEA